MIVMWCPTNRLQNLPDDYFKKKTVSAICKNFGIVFGLHKS